MKDPNSTIDIPILSEDHKLLPFYATAQSAGADVYAYLQNPLIIPPGHSALIPTGIRVAIPDGHVIDIRPRSGLALKYQVTVLNTPGTIDADYRGEIGVILINHGVQEFTVTPGMRIAQLLVLPVLRANFVLCEELTITERGVGGFGHTGG